MKTISIEVPQDGTFVQLMFRGEAASAQAVIVTADDVEIRQAARLPEPAPAAPSVSEVPSAMRSKEVPSTEFDLIYSTLVEQGVKRRTAAVNVIKTMFQFTKPVTTQTANKILDDLRKRGYLEITPNGDTEFLRKQPAET